jgi:hypothetical protein
MVKIPYPPGILILSFCAAIPGFLIGLLGGASLNDLHLFVGHFEGCIIFYIFQFGYVNFTSG